MKALKAEELALPIHRILLVLCLQGRSADVSLDLVEHLLWFAFRVQKVSRATLEDAVGSQGASNCRRVLLLPQIAQASQVSWSPREYPFRHRADYAWI